MDKSCKTCKNFTKFNGECEQCERYSRYLRTEAIQLTYQEKKDLIVEYVFEIYHPMKMRWININSLSYDLYQEERNKQILKNLEESIK